MVKEGIVNQDDFDHFKIILIYIYTTFQDKFSEQIDCKT